MREDGGTHTKVDFENRFQLVLLTAHADSATFSIRVAHPAFEFERDAKKKTYRKRYALKIPNEFTRIRASPYRRDPE
jgi:hypothetical protein